jgi:hypothetical protein
MKRYFNAAGLSQVTLRPVVELISSISDSGIIPSVLGFAEDGMLPVRVTSYQQCVLASRHLLLSLIMQVAHKWIEQLKEVEKNGDFLYSLTLFIVKGVRTAPLKTPIPIVDAITN